MLFDSTFIDSNVTGFSFFVSYEVKNMNKVNDLRDLHPSICIGPFGSIHLEHFTVYLLFFVVYNFVYSFTKLRRKDRR